MALNAGTSLTYRNLQRPNSHSLSRLNPQNVHIPDGNANLVERYKTSVQTY